MRSPNDPVTSPSTGQRFGAEFARNQSAVSRVLDQTPSGPTVVAPLKLLLAHITDCDELTCALFVLRWMYQRRLVFQLAGAKLCSPVAQAKRPNIALFRVTWQAGISIFSCSSVRNWLKCETFIGSGV